MSMAIADKVSLEQVVALAATLDARLKLLEARATELQAQNMALLQEVAKLREQMTPAPIPAPPPRQQVNGRRG